MKLFDITVPIGANKLLNRVIKLLVYYFKQNKENYKGLLTLYTEEEIIDAISSLFISGKAIYASTSGKNGIILRYLEFGGNGIKSQKLLSRASRIISRKVNGDDYVF